MFIFYYKSWQAECASFGIRQAYSVLDILEHVWFPCSYDLASFGASTGAMVSVANIRGTPRGAGFEVWWVKKLEPRR